VIHRGVAIGATTFVNPKHRAEGSTQLTVFQPTPARRGAIVDARTSNVAEHRPSPKFSLVPVGPAWYV